MTPDQLQQLSTLLHHLKDDVLINNDPEIESIDEAIAFVDADLSRE